LVGFLVLRRTRFLKFGKACKCSIRHVSFIPLPSAAGLIERGSDVETTNLSPTDGMEAPNPRKSRSFSCVLFAHSRPLMLAKTIPLPTRLV